MLPFIQPRATKWRKTELTSLSGHRAEKDTHATHTIARIQIENTHKPTSHSYQAIIATHYTLLSCDKCYTTKIMVKRGNFIIKESLKKTFFDPLH